MDVNGAPSHHRVRHHDSLLTIDSQNDKVDSFEKAFLHNSQQSHQRHSFRRRHKRHHLQMAANYSMSDFYDLFRHSSETVRLEKENHKVSEEKQVLSDESLSSSEVIPKRADTKHPSSIHNKLFVKKQLSSTIHNILPERHHYSSERIHNKQKDQRYISEIVRNKQADQRHSSVITNNKETDRWYSSSKLPNKQVQNKQQLSHFNH